MRLTDSPEFERTYRQGKASRGKLFSVHVFPNELGNSRLGLSVSKKVGNAVTRNLVRRRLKEIFFMEVSGISEAYDFVISARQPASKAGFAELREELVKALRKLGLLDEVREDGTRLHG